jgi:hypothetical protein
MTTLDLYTGAGWEASELSALQKEAGVQKGIPAPVGDGGDHQDLKMRVQIDADHLEVFWLPVPFGPTKVSVQGTWLWDPASQTVFSAQRSTKNLPAYDVEASRALPNRDALALAELDGVPQQIRRRYGQAINVSSYVRTLTAEVTQGKTSEYDKAVALQQFFTSARSGFVYNFNASQPVNGEDPLEAFLRGKNGFCEQYATAMAAMLRVAGIPSRVAVGFTPGALLAGSTHTYSVTTLEAHAWPEAWFAGTGWVRFEPTPAASGAQVPDYSLPAATNNPQSPGDPSVATPTPTPTVARPSNGRPDVDILDGRPTVATPTSSGGSAGPSLWLVVPVAVAVLVTLPFLLTLLRRRRRWSRPGPLTAWDQLQDDASDVGHHWNPADSPRAATSRLLAGRRLPMPAVQALDRIAVAAERARYAPAGRQAPGDLASDVAVVRAALQGHASARVRLRAKYLPPSTLAWVAHSLGERVADVLDKVDDTISAVTRPVRRRATAPR